MKALVFALVLAVVATCTILVRNAPIAAQAANVAPATMDCSKAESKMMQAEKMDAAAPAMTGDVDKDFRAMTTSHEKATVVLDQVEAACGKDAATKAAAAAELHDAQQRLHAFSNVRGG